MRRPGTLLRAIAAGFYDARTMERLIDPALADLQLEYEDAVGAGARWRSHWIRARGYVALGRLILLHGAGQVAGMLHGLSPEESRTLRRTIALCVVLTGVGALLLAAPPVVALLSRNAPIPRPLLANLLLQGLPLAMPIGLTFGILLAVESGGGSRRSRLLLLASAAALSILSFTVLAWILPASNHAARVSMAGSPVSKGINELTVGELAHLLETEPERQTSNIARRRPAAFAYHSRWALALAPLVLTAFALGLTIRRPRRRAVLMLAASTAIAGYPFLIASAQLNPTLPPFAAAWSANTVLLILTAALLTGGSAGNHGQPHDHAISAES